MDWKTVYENPGWGPDDLIHLLKRVCPRDPTLAPLCTHPAQWHAAVISGPTPEQTETYQIPGGGPTYGTDGPLNVSFAREGMLGDFDEQFLQIACGVKKLNGRDI